MLFLNAACDLEGSIIEQRVRAQSRKHIFQGFPKLNYKILHHLFPKDKFSVKREKITFQAIDHMKYEISFVNGGSPRGWR